MERTRSFTHMLVPDTARMRDCLRIIDRNGCGIGFVVDQEGRLKGVVTDGDVRRAILLGLLLDAKVPDFMTPNPVAVDCGTPPEKIISLMSKRIKYIPITDNEGRVVDFAAYAHHVHLPIAAPVFSGNELRYVTECVLENWISSQGRFVTEFESAFAKFCGVKHGIAVSNGTVALHLALVIAGIGPGDEVIVPTLTFVATANAVRYTGATPIFVDSEQETWNMDTSLVERRITSRTKAIIPVHLYGCPVDMDPLNELAGQYGLFVIEDAAEAHGAKYKGKRVGSLGHVGCFSFYGNKIVTTGEGGMLTTNDDGLAERARVLRDHGMAKNRRYWHDLIGYNYRLTNLQAAVGVAQMEQVEALLQRRRDLQVWYTDKLRQDPRIELPRRVEWAEPVNWLYTILLRRDFDRDRVIEQLKHNGIDCRPVFYPLHMMPPHIQAGHFPIAEDISRRGLSLPTTTIMGLPHVERVCAALIGALHSPTQAVDSLSFLTPNGTAFPAS